MLPVKIENLIWILFITFLINFSTVSSHATSILLPTDDELIGKADLIIEGTVSSIRSGGNRKNGFKTFVKVKIENTLSGKIDATHLVVRQFGGMDDSTGEKQVIFGNAHYTVGERVLLFLTQNKNGFFETIQLGVGKYTLDGSDASREVDTTEFFQLQNGKPKKIKLGKKSAISLFEKSRSLGRGRTIASSENEIPPTATTALTSTTEFRMMSPASKWFQSEVNVYGATVGDSVLGKDASNRAVKAAAAAWSSGGADLKLTYAGEKSPAGFNCGASDISVSFDDPGNTVADPSPSCTSGALAVGGFCASGVVRDGTYQNITSASIIFNNGWGRCWFWNESNLSEIATHEMGHTLGFAHSSDGTSDPYLENATMYFMAHFDQREASLKDYDIAILKHVYGSTSKVPAPKYISANVTLAANKIVAKAHVTDINGFDVPSAIITFTLDQPDVSNPYNPRIKAKLRTSDVSGNARAGFHYPLQLKTGSYSMRVTAQAAAGGPILTQTTKSFYVP